MIDGRSWPAELRRIASYGRLPAARAIPPGKRDDVLRAFGDAAHVLINNTLRHLGVEVGDSMSEGIYSTMVKPLEQELEHIVEEHDLEPARGI